ncbi:hypothetical protein POTOM_054800 [Populus tomentosa]|uniref:Uncharacterized protein n=1 Tax=Populus tomentosa TaxID=118781 RepID=A0A8X7XW93_POPTO|nr:hypothetical protein POTOM_054800 [Populus tomentosa]
MKVKIMAGHMHMAIPCYLVMVYMLSRLTAPGWEDVIIYVLKLEAFSITRFVLQLQDIEKEISELKMSVNTRGRLVATEFLKQFI